ncbi:hypothetical protein INTERNEXUS_271 [Bacillus phage vB_BspM_Internexus]|nr:hypothetical protein INTERNEXUS_271 [Bacillus phage vB_BspM_Internexus]
MKRKIYNEDIISKEVSIINPEYEYVKLIKLKGVHSKILINHKTCGRNIEIIFNNFKNGRICKYCSKNCIDEKSFRELVKEDTDYIFESFISMNKKMTVTHKKCRYVYEVRPSDFVYNKHRCPNCSNRIAYTEKTLSKKIKSIDSEYEMIETIDGSGVRSKIKLNHKKCNKSFQLIARNFLINNQRCPYCYSKRMFNPSFDSKGIKKIKEWLDKEGFKYETEKTYDDLISPFSNKKLRFDIFLPHLNTLIEFDGKFHFKYSNSSKIFSKENLEKTKIRDEVKNQYCKENNITLLRISYTDNIHYKLDKHFKSNNSTTIETTLADHS